MVTHIAVPSNIQSFIPWFEFVPSLDRRDIPSSHKRLKKNPNTFQRQIVAFCSRPIKKGRPPAVVANYDGTHPEESPRMVTEERCDKSEQSEALRAKVEMGRSQSGQVLVSA